MNRVKSRLFICRVQLFHLFYSLVSPKRDRDREVFFYFRPGCFIARRRRHNETFPRVRRKLSRTMQSARGLMFPLSNGLRCRYKHTSSDSVYAFLRPDTATMLLDQRSTYVFRSNTRAVLSNTIFASSALA